MKITQKVDAPPDTTFSRFAFNTALGKSMPLKLDGDTVGDATLVGAVVSDDSRWVDLTFDIDGLDAALHHEWWITRKEPQFDPPDIDGELNPARALRILEREVLAEVEHPPGWQHLAVRLHRVLCEKEAHPAGETSARCNAALNECYDWLIDARLDAGIAIARDARVGYPALQS